MSSKWEKVPIESICLGIFDGPHATPTKTSDGPVFLGISALNSGQLDLSNTEHLSEDDFIKWTKRVVPQAGDIVFSYETRLGQVAVIPAGLRCCLGRRMALMRVNPEKVMSDYLLYAYLSPEFQEVIRQRTVHGSTVDRIPLTEFGSFPISVPPLDVQAKVVEILRAIDDRITLLRETNATLEAIAQALFKSWFVDFDPVRAEMEGRVSEGMDEATAALFPDGLEESELGAVPIGWRVRRLGDVSSYLSRGISPKYLEDGGVLVLNQKCIRDFSVDYCKGRRHDSSQRKIEGRQIATGDVLVNSTGVGTLGRVAQVLSLPEAAVIVDSHITIVRPGPNLSWHYLGQFMMRKQPEIEAMGEGSTGQTELSRSKLAEVFVLVPPEHILAAFDSLVIPVKQRISLNESRIQNMAKLRDVLLPRLISGQLRILEAESQIDALAA